MQGDGGAITITPDDGDINVGPTAPCSVGQRRSNQLGKLQLVDFGNERRHDQTGRQSLFHHPDPHARPRANMRQGMLESFQRPAGDRNQPNDRDHAGLSGDRDPLSSPRKI